MGLVPFFLFFVIDGSYRGLTTLKGFFFSSARDNPNEFADIGGDEIQVGVGVGLVQQSTVGVLKLVTRLVP